MFVFFQSGFHKMTKNTIVTYSCAKGLVRHIKCCPEKQALNSWKSKWAATANSMTGIVKGP